MPETFKKIKWGPLTISACVIFLGVLGRIFGIPFLDLMELKTVDLRYSARGAIPTSEKIVLAVIDEKSLAREGKWVWSRDKFAELINILSDSGANVIGFDVGFVEKDEKSIIQVINRIESQVQRFNIQNEPLNRYFNRLKQNLDYDTILANSIQNSRAKIVLGFFFLMENEETQHITQKELEEQLANAYSAKVKIVRHASIKAFAVHVNTAAVPQANIKIIADATRYAGFFNMVPDPDGIVRSLPAFFKCKEDFYMPLSLSVAAAYLDQPLEIDISDYSVSNVNIGPTIIPTDDLGFISINYRGKKRTFLQYSITDILNNKIPPDTFKDKIVLVGATATGIYDMRATPMDEVYPGVEIHATVIDNIITRNFIRKPDWAGLLDVLSILIIGGGLGFFLPRMGAITGAFITGSAFLVYIIFCYFWFTHYAWILNMVYPLIVILFLYIGLTIYKYLVEEHQKRFVKNAFSTYLAPSVVEHLLTQPDKLKLGGEKRHITAFFSDVQGFTSISEKLEPTELVDLLNEFLTEMTDIILNHEGMVDKFEGDAIIAIFGAPNDLDNQAETACSACIRMQQRLVQLREKWHAEGRPELKMRIGLCTGIAVVGNMGSKSRMDYTMMGDTVNIAARLEGVNKLYGTYTIVSESTYREATARNLIIGREIDAINVVGKLAPIRVYELIGFTKEITDQQKMLLSYYTEGLDAYRNRNWIKAEKYFRAALKVSPMDGPSRTLISRCTNYKHNPPQNNWNGAFTMLNK